MVDAALKTAIEVPANQNNSHRNRPWSRITAVAADQLAIWWGRKAIEMAQTLIFTGENEVLEKHTVWSPPKQGSKQEHAKHGDLDPL